ncbi:MAG: Rieske 2Fe-2S domain-containing protein [Actinomycetota bacterium]
MSVWTPVADQHDVIERHLARTALHGQELVVWRADDGHLNAWENRCLHRGVRLSLGVNEGAELVCRYHAWRYANRSGGCTYIPAHPADSPARTATCTTFPVAERYGLVWATIDTDDDPAPPVVDALEDGWFVLRARPVRASLAIVERLLAELVFEPAGSSGISTPMVRRDTVPGGMALTVSDDSIEESVVFFVQPVAHGRCVIRPVRAGEPAAAMATLRHHAAVLSALVEEAERLERIAPPTRPPETVVGLPTRSPSPERLTVRIARKWETATGIAAFELVDAGGATLPVVQPGDHIDLHLPGGLVRQYSLTNAPHETDRYRIGVKRLPDSTGGSEYLHDAAAVGDTLEISAPRNRFPLRRNVPTTMLIAGGIGITPIVAMAQALDRVGLDFTVHYFAGSDAEFAFGDVLERLGSSVQRHVGLDAEQTGAVLADLLRTPDPSVQVAACGPPPMLDELRRIADAAGWPPDAVTFEYFRAADIDDSSAFTIELARSARTVEVAAGERALDAIRAVGIAIDSSCERGACGTCSVGVLEGEVAHNDVFLSAGERAAGETILLCVSRAASDRLVLDL